MNPDYPVKIKRSKRKTASIYIERDGSLSVLVPDKYSDQEVGALLKANEYKIFKYQAKRELLNEKAVKREPVNGQSFIYLGCNYYLGFSAEVNEIKFKGRFFYAPEGATHNLNLLFKAFYKRRSLKYLIPRVMKYAEKIGVQVEEVSVLDLKTSWGSCSVKKPKINLHWKVMMAPVSVIDYLIVHELTHFNLSTNAIMQISGMRWISYYRITGNRYNGLKEMGRRWNYRMFFVRLDENIKA